MPSYLITGTTRGIGHGLVSELLLRPNSIVVAGARDPASPASQALLALPKADRTQLIIVKIDAQSETDPFEAVEQLRTEHGITHLDVVIANAGIATSAGPVATTPARELREHWEVNTLGSVLLFQAVFPLLQPVANAPASKFVFVSSDSGSISNIDALPFALTAYGSSKAAINWLMRRIHFDNDWIVTFSMQPGWVSTDLGNRAASILGMNEAPVSIKESTEKMLLVIDAATREQAGGKWLKYDGEFLNF